MQKTNLVFILVGIWNIGLPHFLQHFGRRNGLYNEADGIGHEKRGKFGSIHFPVRFIGRIKKDKENDKFQKTARHEDKTDLGLHFISEIIQSYKYDGRQQEINEIGKHNIISIFWEAIIL